MILGHSKCRFVHFEDCLFRLVGEGSRGVRIECRIPSADMNPYLACAAQLAAGLAGIEEELPCRPPRRATSTAPMMCPRCPRPCARRPRSSASRRCCARRWEGRSSTTTRGRPRWGRRITTALSPTTSCGAGSSRPERLSSRPAGPKSSPLSRTARGLPAPEGTAAATVLGQTTPYLRPRRSHGTAPTTGPPAPPDGQDPPGAGTRRLRRAGRWWWSASPARRSRPCRHRPAPACRRPRGYRS